MGFLVFRTRTFFKVWLVHFSCKLPADNIWIGLPQPQFIQISSYLGLMIFEEIIDANQKVWWWHKQNNRLTSSYSRSTAGREICWIKKTKSNSLSHINSNSCFVVVVIVNIVIRVNYHLLSATVFVCSFPWSPMTMCLALTDKDPQDIALWHACTGMC